MALYSPRVAYEMNRMLPCQEGGSLLLGSMADPSMFAATAETFAAASTTMRFDDGATIKNMKHRSLTLTDNLTALVIRCPNKNGIIQLDLIQDSTGSRTIPTPTAVKSDGTTAVTITFNAGAFITESTTASVTDTMQFIYNESAATLVEQLRIKGS